MIFLDAATAKHILEALGSERDEIDVSIDLGVSSTRLRLSEYTWDIERLEKITKDPDTVYFISDDGIFKAAIDGAHFYKLVPTGRDQAPALLIDGVLMHRVKDIDPMTDARSKAVLCTRKGFKMLEVCTGLGYSTISCLERGVDSIVTIEKDKDVLDLARINPWSQKLFSDDRVELIHGDATDVVSGLKNRAFDGILHDPPRFSMGSDLYTAEFYKDLFRVLKSKGLLFHYVGSPGSRHRRRDLPKGVIARLRAAGFTKVARNASALGVTARKP